MKRLAKDRIGRGRSREVAPDTIGSELNAEDLKALEGSFITPELAQRAGLRRVDRKQGTRLVERHDSDSEDNSGIAIPYIWPGVGAETYGLRRDNPLTNESAEGEFNHDGQYVLTPGMHGVIYVPPGVRHHELSKQDLSVVVTIGEKNALALHRVAEENSDRYRLRFLTIAFPDAWKWRTKELVPNDELELEEISRPIAKMDKIWWWERNVYIVFDADANTNPQVRAARDRLAEELTNRGASVSIVNLPDDSGVNGVDEYLARNGADCFLREVFAQAHPFDPKERNPDDLQNADNFVTLYNKDVRWVGDSGVWAAWINGRWALGSDGQRAVRRKAAEMGERRDSRSGPRNRAKIDSMLTLARDAPLIYIPKLSAFDANRMVLNVANGTLDLQTGELRVPRRSDLISKLASVNFDPKAKCPEFENFLQEVFDPHPEIIPWLQRAIGYSMTGHTREHVIFIAHGSGRNGKGVLFNGIEKILGDYAYAASISSLMERRDGGGPNEGVANLVGRRFVTAQEPSEHRRYDAALLKTLSGGDTITAHRKFEHEFSFSPTHKIWIATNPPPLLPAADDAIWARVRLIPFDVSFRGRENRALPDILWAEASGILNWMVEGCLLWQEKGLGSCEAVDVATQVLRESNDQVAQFIEEECEAGEGLWVKPQDLYDVYKKWAEKNGHGALSITKFGIRLDALKIPKTTVNGSLRRNGLQLGPAKIITPPHFKLATTPRRKESDRVAEQLPLSA